MLNEIYISTKQTWEKNKNPTKQKNPNKQNQLKNPPKQPHIPTQIYL